MSDREHSSAPSHPDELLAGLVDGSLTPAERAEVQSHLEGCARCRAEVTQAESARRALRGLPEMEPPWGLGRAAVEEARRAPREHWLRRFAPAAGVAAAALLLVGLAFAVLRGPQGGGSANSAAPAAGGGVSAPAGATAVPGAAEGPLIRSMDANFDAKGIDNLAAGYAKSDRLAPAAPQPSAAPPPPSAAATPAFSTGSTQGRRVPLSDESAIVGCIDAAAGLEGSSRPARVIVARFDEKPALIGIYLNSPGADQPADLLVIWVASRECSLLHYASHRIQR